MPNLASANFFQKKIYYLGYVLSKEEVVVDPDKIKSIMEWPTPKGCFGYQVLYGLRRIL
jgi:hypothetical protein